MNNNDELNKFIRYDKDKDKDLLNIPVILGDDDEIYVRLKNILRILELQFNRAQTEEAKDNAALLHNLLDK